MNRFYKKPKKISIDSIIFLGFFIFFGFLIFFPLIGLKSDQQSYILNALQSLRFKLIFGAIFISSLWLGKKLYVSIDIGELAIKINNGKHEFPKSGIQQIIFSDKMTTLRHGTRIDYIFDIETINDDIYCIETANIGDAIYYSKEFEKFKYPINKQLKYSEEDIRFLGDVYKIKLNNVNKLFDKLGCFFLTITIILLLFIVGMGYLITKL